MNSAERLKAEFREIGVALSHLSDAYGELALGGQTQAHRAICMYMGEVVSAIERVVDVGRKIEFDDRELLKYLKGYGIRANDVTLYDVDDKFKKLCVRACLSKGQCITTREFSTIIGPYFDKKFLSVDGNRNIINRDWHEYTFVMAPMFKSVWHVENVCKDKAYVSGDCFSYMSLPYGRDVIAIVDGCGSGARANHDSKLVIELLEEFVNAGFSYKGAISMINAAFAINDNIGTPQTLDMCVMDLYLGVCNFVKLGAVSTFIKRSDWVEIIKSTTLPMGVLDSIDFDNSVKKVYAGDAVFMISDGVLEAFDVEDKEEMMMRLILNLNRSTPKEMSREIIKRAKAACGGRACDDMTVAVIMIE